MTGFLLKPKASVSITLSRDTVNLGEEITGVLYVTSEEEFDADEIRLIVVGFVPNAIPYGGGADMCALWKIIKRESGPLHLTQGYRQEFPFSIKIPVRPNSRTKGKDGVEWLKVNPDWRSKIKWEAVGVIDIKRRRDVASSTSFHVPLPPLTEEEKKYVQRRDAKTKVALILFIGTICFLMGLILYTLFAQVPNERTFGIVLTLFGLSLIMIGIYKSHKLRERRGILK